jgi:hypothetical protein
MEAPQLSEEDMQLIYNWVDEIPLSRPKRNIARDFSDGGKRDPHKVCIVLVAEIIKHFLPHMVELHNYSAAHSVSQKTYNWNTLNHKLFKKIGFTLVKKDVDDVVNCVPETIERILKVLQINIASYQERKAKKLLLQKEGDEPTGVGQGQTFAPMMGYGNKENYVGGQNISKVPGGQQHQS